MMEDIATVVSSDICRTLAFLDDYRRLTKMELAPNEEQLDDNQIKHLLESAAVLSLSSSEHHRKLAYKIAVYLLKQYKSEYPIVPFVVQLIMTRLGDLPTIHHMITSGDALDDFGYIQTYTQTDGANPSLSGTSVCIRFPEVLEKKALNQIQIADRKVLTLTDFQAEVLRLLNNKYDIIFSAPTSAGKSYVILSYLAERMQSSQSYCAIYLVPTKALVSEVQGEITRALIDLEIPTGYRVFTGAGVLNREEITNTSRKALVLTQERLQEMLADGTLSFKVDLLVVDEAQQVGHESRGIIVEDAVEELLRRDREIQKVFISPYITNLEKYAKIFAIESKVLKTTKTTKSPVAHNIFLVTFKEEEPRRYSVTSTVLLQEIEADNKERPDLTTVGVSSWESKRKFPETISSRKVWVALNMIGRDEPTLIYCNTPADCRRVGRELAAALDKEQSNYLKPSPELKEAISYLKEHVHPQYYLADFLSYGIAYHYGTMPQFVRFHIKRLFEQKNITYLACTSTLLEGVNLPAKNLVLYKPRKGIQLPMDTLSIRNLIGRAGRLNKDYYGKIYCIEKDQWEPPSNEVFDDKPEEIESSSSITLSEDQEDLVSYLRDVSFKPSSTRVKSIISMATSLLMKQMMYPNADFLSKYKQLDQKISQGQLDTIGSILVAETAKIPSAHRQMILKNRSIDPRLQYRLYQVLKQNTNRVLPPFPNTVNFYRDLQSIFLMVAEYLLRQNTAQNKSYRHFAYLANEWIGQKPYKKILDGQIRWAIIHGHFNISKRKEEVNEIIEQLDEDIETDIRFEYTRCLKCYCDIIEQILSEEGLPATYCRLLPTFLEAGTSDERILFLIGAGLSRNVAIEIFAAVRDLPSWKTVAETAYWLQQNKPMIKQRLHPVLYREAERIID
jgi:superfamily II DNA or RNA helicase